MHVTGTAGQAMSKSIQHANKKLSKYLPSFLSSSSSSSDNKQQEKAVTVPVNPTARARTTKKKDKTIPFAYVRIKFSKLVENGWDKPPSWIIFKPNPCYQIIKPGLPLPSALLACRIGTQSSYPGSIPATARPFLHIPKSGHLDLKIESAANLPDS